MITDDKPIVVITRHPDYADEIELFGADIQVIYLDLGSEFDSTPNDREQAFEWARGTLEEVRELPNEHPARQSVENTVSTTVEDTLTENEVEALLNEFRQELTPKQELQQHYPDGVQDHSDA